MLVLGEPTNVLVDFAVGGDGKVESYAHKVRHYPEGAVSRATRKLTKGWGHQAGGPDDNTTVPERT